MHRVTWDIKSEQPRRVSSLALNISSIPASTAEAPTRLFTVPVFLAFVKSQVIHLTNAPPGCTFYALYRNTFLPWKILLWDIISEKTYGCIGALKLNSKCENLNAFVGKVMKGAFYLGTDHQIFSLMQHTWCFHSNTCKISHILTTLLMVCRFISPSEIFSITHHHDTWRFCWYQTTTLTSLFRSIVPSHKVEEATVRPIVPLIGYLHQGILLPSAKHAKILQPFPLDKFWFFSTHCSTCPNTINFCELSTLNTILVFFKFPFRR